MRATIQYKPHYSITQLQARYHGSALSNLLPAVRGWLFLEYTAVRETKLLWDFEGKGNRGDCCLSWRLEELVLVRSPSVAGTTTWIARVQYLTGKKTCGKPRHRWQHSVTVHPKSV